MLSTIMGLNRKFCLNLPSMSRSSVRFYFFKLHRNKCKNGKTLEISGTYLCRQHIYQARVEDKIFVRICREWRSPSLLWSHPAAVSGQGPYCCPPRPSSRSGCRPFPAPTRTRKASRPALENDEFYECGQTGVKITCCRQVGIPVDNQAINNTITQAWVYFFGKFSVKDRFF